MSRKDAPIKSHPKNAEKYFTTSIPTSPGDSGGPIVALRDGNIELVGLMESVSTKNSCISFAVGIDAIMERIKDEGLTDLYESMQDKMYKPY